MKMRRITTNILLLSLVMALLPARTTQAATISVTTSNDSLDAAANCAAVTVASLPGPDGVTSLREAMCAANTNAVEDTINFNIPGAGVQTIDLDSALPQLVDDLTTIDGYTQFGAAPATIATPATILIEIDGTDILHNGLNVTSSGNVIRGLAIYGFVGSGIYIANYAGSIANDNVIAGNYIGTNASGVSCLANGLNGVFVGAGAQNNTIGGDSPADRNLISCNGWEGVGIHGSGTTGNVVSGNYIGVDRLGTTSRANTLDGVRIYGGAQNNTVGGDTEGERNVISGNLENGVHIAGEDTTDNVVSGNYIGVDATGTTALPNYDDGVRIIDAPDNLIGGDTPGERNVISGNDKYGIHILNEGTVGNTVSGNYIGVDESGTEALGNGNHGVRISNAHNNLIGGDTEGERNVISGNGNDGVKIINGATGNVVSGNYIGVDATGATALPNHDDGVDIFSGSDNLIGGDAPGKRNVISGNVEDGVRIVHRATGNVVSGNYIGVDASGVAAIPNNRHGVYIGGGARNNVIGGNTEGERNVISGNGHAGVWIGGDLPEITSGNTVLGNYIGLLADGVTSLANERNGVRISLNGQDNTIGPGNMIAHNGDDGIGVYTSTAFGNTITKNSIFSNADLGIDLTNGANNEMPAPTILTHRFPRSSSIWQVFHTDISRFEGLRTAISGQFLVKPWLRTHIWGLADQQYRQEYLPI